MATERARTINRLRRIEGQVRGVAQMVADDRYCIDILHQTAAIRAALAGVERAILQSHARCCVADAIASGDVADQRAKVAELIDLIDRGRR